MRGIASLWPIVQAVCWLTTPLWPFRKLIVLRRSRMCVRPTHTSCPSWIILWSWYLHDLPGEIFSSHNNAAATRRYNFFSSSSFISFKCFTWREPLRFRRSILIVSARASHQMMLNDIFIIYCSILPIHLDIHNVTGIKTKQMGIIQW